MNKSVDAKQVLVRVPPDVRQWLALQAERNVSSLQAEVVRSIRDRMERGDREV